VVGLRVGFFGYLSVFGFVELFLNNRVASPLFVCFNTAIILFEDRLCQVF